MSDHDDGDGDGARELAVAERLSQEIADAIMVGEFPFGSWLRQEQLAHRFGVSRQPIREALHRLEMVGMIEALPRRGVRVSGPQPNYIREGYLIRAALEGLAARLAATRVTEPQLDELREVCASFRSSIEADAGSLAADQRALWIRDHNRFHELILEASGVERLAQQIRSLNLTLPRNMSLAAVRAMGRLEENIRQHEIIVGALELHSGTLAAKAMEEHITRSGQLIADWYEREQRR